jgi:hypothetical protein
VAPVCGVIGAVLSGLWRRRFANGLQGMVTDWRGVQLQVLSENISEGWRVSIDGFVKTEIVGRPVDAVQMKARRTPLRLSV